MNETSREALMKRLQVQSFVLDDIILYLQTHPTDQNALHCYEKFKNLRNETMEEYTHNFGPINTNNVEITDRWTWADTPWPWERQV